MQDRLKQKNTQVADANADAARSARSAKWSRRASWAALVSAVVISLLSAGYVLSRVPTLAAEVLALARADTGQGARDDLDVANARLVDRGLPLFELPPPGAPNYVVQRQAARAWARSDYPEVLAEQIREDVRRGRRPAVEPVARRDPPGAADRGDEVVVTTTAGPTLVEVPPASSSAAPSGARPKPPARPAATPAPPSVPGPQTGRGLLPLLPDLPVRVPLLSE